MPQAYVDRLLGELDTIQACYLEVLAGSGIRSTNLPSNFIDFALWEWQPSDAALEQVRMDLLGTVRDWTPRLRLLFPHPTPNVTQKLDEHLGRLEQWLVREPNDHSLPSTIDEAAMRISEASSVCES